MIYDWAYEDEHTIYGFVGNNSFLSNFYPCEVWYDGVMFPTSENAYQAAKVPQDKRKLFVTCTPAKSKKLWKDHTKMNTAQWNELRMDVMTQCVYYKFTQNTLLSTQLLNTGNKYLIEANLWNDEFWGFNVKNNKGENNLGKLLMRVRNYLSLSC